LSGMQHSGEMKPEEDPAFTPTVFERSKAGRRGVLPPPCEKELPPIEECVPIAFLRKGPVGLPEVSELDAVRHYTRLSQKNMSVDGEFYPLGSCTMKYNPRVNEAAAALPGFRKIHPLQPDEEVQGLLGVLYGLQEALIAVSGLADVSLQPAAGAHGEMTAMMMIRAFHEEHEPGARKTVLIPDSAHGTNPASSAIAGFQVREVKSGADGTVDLEDLRSKLGPDVAAMMITNPNTLGIFEARILEVSRLLHERGAFLYMDGANMNAILGIARPGDFGVDVMHFNLHKTFSTPHGGGGPGAGPVAACATLAPYLPAPRVKRSVPPPLVPPDPPEHLCAREGTPTAEGTASPAGPRYVLDPGSPRSIGKVRSFFGNTGILLRAAAYIAAHGPRELREVSEAAVLNAGYVRARLGGEYHLPYETPTLHEVVFTARNQVRANGIRALDIAKRLIDLGFHPPTIYFPLVVHEALMIEPTETESLETLDAFCAAMLRIAAEARDDPQVLREAPVKRPVRRLDEVAAVKSPVLVCPSAERS
jgi:glycine dehydrogenase subunit 2